MHPLRTLVRPIIHAVLATLVLSHAALASDKKRPDAGPIVSGWNIDLVDIVESGFTRAATSADPYVFAAFGTALVVLDVSTPGDPVRVGAALFPSLCEDMDLEGDFLYCHCGDTVEIVDVTEPSAPTIVGSLFVDFGNRLDADGDRLYVEAWNVSFPALQVYDLTNPAAPALLGTSTFVAGDEFEARNGYVYSTYNASGFKIIDATNPANPVVAGSLPTGNAAANVDAAWPYAYVVNYTTGGRGLYVIDVSNPAAPSQVGFYPSAGFPDIYQDVAVNGNRAYIASSGTPTTLDVFDISNPAAPVKLPSVFFCAGTVDESIDLSGRLAVFPSDYSLCVMDCSNATVPVAHARYEALPTPTGLALTPTHLVMSGGGGNLALVNRDDTQDRSFLVLNRDTFNSFDVAVKGDYAYIPGCSFVIGGGDVYAYDISDPANPSGEGGAGWVGCLFGNVLGANHSYLWDTSRLLSVDISNPAAPAVAGQLTTPGIHQIAVADPYLYAVTSDAGLRIFNATNPAAPFEVGPGISEAALGGQPLQIAVSNGYAFILVTNNTATGGMRVVNVADPLLPAIVGNFEVPAPFGGGSVAANDGMASFHAADGILRVIDVSDPTDPIEVGNIQAGQFNSPLRLAPPFIYVLGSGLHILKFETDLVTGVGTPARSPFSLGQNYPNPFNPSTRISFELRSPSRAVIEIFDVQGSRVRTLVDESMTAGPHRVEWNGRDDEGTIVGSGVYFYRLTAGGRTQAKKMVVLK